MRHLEEGRLLALLDDELDAPERAEAEAHLESCAPCRELREVVVARDAATRRALEGIDVPPRTERALAGVRAALAGSPPAERPARPARVDGRRARGPWAWWNERPALARAALVLLMAAVAGGVSAAVPGSPVRAWLGLDEGSGSPEAATAAAGDDEQAPSGIRGAPAEGSLEIVLSEVPTGAEVVVRLVDGPQGAIEARGRVRYTRAAGRLEAAGPRGPVAVDLPRSVDRASISVDGQVYLEKRGDDLRLLVPATERTENGLRFRTR